MSASVPPGDPASPAPEPPSTRAWGAPVVSVYSLSLLLVALCFAYLVKNDTLLTALVAVIATNATSVVSFYVGSSASSQAKDVVISNQLPTPPPPVGPAAHHL
jgi:hypothetical protein